MSICAAGLNYDNSDIDEYCEAFIDLKKEYGTDTMREAGCTADAVCGAGCRADAVYGEDTSGGDECSAECRVDKC